MPRLFTPAIWLLTLAFAAFSTWVLLKVGFVGIWQGGLANLGSTQITVDLVIACLVALGFIVQECRAQERAWWPWALMTAVGGSLGLLAYLLWTRR